MSTQFSEDFEANVFIDGPVDGPVVVFGHALGVDRTMWDDSLAALKDKYRVVSIDWHGHGASSVHRPPYDMEILRRDFLRVMTALTFREFFYVGCSMGGMIGQMLGVSHPHVLRGLVLCCTTSRVPPETAPIWQERIDTVRSGGMEAVVEPTIQRWFSKQTLESGGALLDRTRALLRKTPPEGYIGWCEAIRSFDMTDLLPLIDVPTLVIHGREDEGTPVAAAETIAQTIPCRLEVLDNASHMLPMERPAEFNTLLREFLDSQT